jgi:two-component system response regulator RegX3
MKMLGRVIRSCHLICRCCSSIETETECRIRRYPNDRRSCRSPVALKSGDICKPFSPREVIARVRAVLRRGGTTIDAPPALLHFGRLEIDEAAREARVDGVDVRLKPREFALLLELARNVGIALSRERLLERVWGFDFDGDERTVDVHVRRLRAKIEEEAKLPPMVQTIHGFGYKFVRA